MIHRVDVTLVDPEVRALELEQRSASYREELPSLRTIAEDTAVLYLRNEPTSERRATWEDAERDVLTCVALIRRVRTLARQIRQGMAKQRSRGREEFEDAGQSLDEAVRVAMLARARRILKDHTLRSTSVEAMRQWRAGQRRRERLSKRNQARGGVVAGASGRRRT